MLPGADRPLPASPTPVPIINPATSKSLGTIVVQSDGKYSFRAEPSYLGPVPALTVIVTSSDGQSKGVTINILVIATAARE